jgi:hypothetical protein
MRIRNLRAHLRQLPEEAGPSGGLFGWDAVRRMFEPPPPVRIALKVLRAYGEDGTQAAKRAFEEETSVTPDTLLVTRLCFDLESPGQVIVPRLGRLLDEHRQRLHRRQEASLVPEETERRRRGIRRFPSVDVALDALRVAGQSREEALQERIPGVAYVEKAESPPGSNVAGAVGSAIRKEGLERPDQPNLITPLTHEIRDDLRELVAFFQREELRDLRGDASRAGLSAQEE